jgi:hypothetical protein
LPRLVPIAEGLAPNRFALAKVLGSDAFVGKRPREEGKVPETLLVTVQNATGDASTYSLWR